MNSEKVQTIITETIETFRKSIRHARQYAPAKHQIATLTELGIIDLMPKNFGHGDAGAIIKEAQRGATSVMDANGEGSEIKASALYQAMNEVEAVAPDTVFVGMTTIGYNTGKIFLADGATVSEARNNSLDAIILDWQYATIYDDTKRKNLEIVPLSKAKQYGYQQKLR
jgi:hypothetical protein